MKVFITGGTGFVGSHTVSEVLKNGHEVRLLVRSMDKIEPALKPLGVQDADAIQGDVLNRESIEKAAEGCDATIHCGSVYSLDPRAAEVINNTNVTGTDNVLGIANRLGHDPIIHVSSFVALIGQNGTTINPDSPPTKPPGAYFRSKADSDQVARTYQERGVPVVITYPGSVWGSHDPNLGESFQMSLNALKGVWKMTVKGNIPISDVRDVAKLHAALLEKGKGPRRYFAPMRDVTLSQVMSVISEVTGRKLDTTMLPSWCLLFPTKCMDLIQPILKSRLPFNYQAIYCTTRNHNSDDSRTRKDLNIEPRPLAETMRDQIRWMLQEGHIDSSLAGTLNAN